MAAAMTPRRLLLAALVVLLAILNVKALLGTVLIDARFAVDMEIPLRAAERWQAGQAPYLASAFGSVAVAVMLAASVAACRRLGIPWLWLPLVLMWPPFAESIFGANVQTVLFAAFIFLFYRPGALPWDPTVRD